jgi:glycosyltransferase involved in cell wall biosynthesis/2-polyprenyl-3-methyl-5-hydroxy-6-metoxy-1,4-benzoquinol methylase/tetratricopeptide (TPR) repeat protein/GT2 family glycosyltransferase
MSSRTSNQNVKSVEPFLIVSIDTECDKSHNWRTASPLTFRGVVDAIPGRLQPLFCDFGIRPTYLISPEVMCHPASVATLRNLRDVELTTHLHGDYILPKIKTWDFAGTITDEMQWEYGPDLERAKLASLTEMFIQQFGCQPRTFRAGRFGASPHTGAILRDLGYVLDSSVTPHICWTSRKGEKRPDYRGFSEMPYTLGREGDIWKSGVGGEFLELPVTILPADAVAANATNEPIWFRPWYSDADTLCRVFKHVLDQPPVNGVRRPLVMMFHNVELLAGASPYPQTETEVQRYLDMMKRVFDLAAKCGVRACTMAEYHTHYFGQSVHPDASSEVSAAVEISAIPAIRRQAHNQEDRDPALKLSPRLVEEALDAFGVQPWFKYVFRERSSRWDVCQPCQWMARNIEPKAPVLSIGTGVGFNLFWLAENGFTHLHGTDIDGKAVDAGRKIALTSGLPVALVVDDALKGEALRNEQFAVIEALNWCHLLEDFSLDRLLDRYTPHLREHGVFIFDAIDAAYNALPGNQYNTADGAKPEIERRPSEYRTRLSRTDVEAAFARHGLHIEAAFSEPQTIPKVVYVGRLVASAAKFVLSEPPCEIPPLPAKRSVLRNVSAAVPPAQSVSIPSPVAEQEIRSKKTTMHSQPLSARKPAPTLPRVLMIADVPNWIFERHARTLHALLNDEFDFTLGFQKKNFNEDDFDLIYPLEFNLIDAAKIRNPAKYVTGIRSHLSWQPLDFLQFTQSLTRNFGGVHVVSKRLYKIFHPFVVQTELISHGVDTGFFTPKTKADQSLTRLRLGWAGNRLSGSKKGFKEIIEPLGKLPGVELIFCGYSDRNLSLEQMKEFYDSLDAYICASDFEGNNNSLMEAASMQRAIITTDNGAVPEYLKNGESALIVERELPNFMRAVMQLRDDPSLRVRLGAAAGEAVRAKYDWKEMGGHYRRFFRNALNAGQGIQSAAVEIGDRAVAVVNQDTQFCTCPVCRGNAPHGLNKSSQDYYICSQCGVVFTPRINPALLLTENNGAENRHHPAMDTLRLRRLEAQLGRPVQKMVDFGCGQGQFVKLMRTLNVACEGIDQNTELQLAGLANGSLDGITMTEVIEHLYEPQGIFREFHRVLRPGGIVYIESSFVNGQNLAAWEYLDPAIGHCTVHSEKSLSHLAKMNGFTAIKLNDNVYCLKNGGEPADSISGSASPDGFSFCIITNGKRPEKLRREIESIRALEMPNYEILVGGDVPPGLDGVTVVSLPEAATGGRLGEMRNRLIERSRFDRLIVADDDLLFQAGFYQGLLQFGENYEVQCVRFLNADGTRYWDWATASGPRGHNLLDYDQTDPHVYVTGGLCIMKASVAKRVKWDDHRGFYQGEDSDFSRRLHEAGISIKFNRHCTVVHSDTRLTQLGTIIVGAAGLRDAMLRKVGENRLEEARALYQRLRNMDPEEGAVPAEQAELGLFVKKREGRFVYLAPEFLPAISENDSPQNVLNAATQRLKALLPLLGPFYLHMGGAGDALLLLSGFYDSAPQSVVLSLPNSIPAMKSLFEAFPALERVYFLPSDVGQAFHLLLRLLARHLPNCLGKGTTPDSDYFKEWNKSLNIFETCGVQASPEWAWRYRKPSGARRVVLAPRGSLAGMVGSKRNIMDPKAWSRIIEIIQQQQFRPVIIGTPDEAGDYPCLPGCEDRRSYSFQSQMEQIGASDILVGADSWAKTFSALANVPTIVFEPLRGQDWICRKDPSDYVFVDPWPSITMVKDCDHFQTVFAKLAEEIKQGSASPRPVNGAKPINVAWDGSFLDFGSLSHVNRALTAALEHLPGWKLSRIVSNAVPKGKPGEPHLRELAGQLKPKAPRDCHVTVRHAWPPNWRAANAGSLVVIQPWEYGTLPAEWVSKARQVRQFWVPSEYVRRVYVNSGVPASKVKVVPNGIDPELFRPDAPPLPLATNKSFKFLFVGGTIHRKGPDVLLEAFLKAFTSKDDVCLVIKDFGGKSVYAGQTIERAIHAAQQQSGAPEILHLTDEIVPEQMPGLYAACNCLVHPYRGEGFGLPILEAMACGLPVVVTAGGAADDFATDTFAYRIPSTRRSIGSKVSDIPLVRDGWLLEPDAIALQRQMQWIHGNPAEARAKGQAASAHVRQFWTWERAAHRAAGLLRDIVAQDEAEAAALETRRARQLTRIELPAAARMGNLSASREFIAKRDWSSAWQAMLAALAMRPFHPEAFLLLAEVALAAGDSVSARQCAQHARKLAPDWKPVRHFLKGNLHGNTKPEWLHLPAVIADANAGSRPRLSVCLIAKNEEKFLDQCLASVRGLADQIVVVDTGSTDRTVEIAREHGAETHIFEWCDDFSAARNAALEHATGDWVLILDADEELLPEHRETILKEIGAASVMAYRLPIIDKGNEEDGCSHVPRLFRNAPGLFFVGRIHEQVFSSIEVRRKEWGLDNSLGKSAILHHGYGKELLVSRDKVARNLKLLQIAIEEMPDEPNLLMNLGLELVRSGRLDEGLEQYSLALRAMSKLPPSQVVPELRESLLTQMATHLLAARRFTEITELCQSSLARATGLTASLHFMLGLAQMELKKPAEAVEQMRQCLAKRSRPALSPVSKSILRGGPNHCLALCLAALKKPAEAGEAFRAALADDPVAPGIRFDFARFLAGQGDAVEALKLLHALATGDPRQIHVWQFGGQIALGRPEFLEFAHHWTTQAVGHYPEDTRLLLQHAEALLLGQNAERALPLWLKAHARKSTRHLAAIVLCEIATGVSGHRISSAEEPAISQEFIKWYRQLIRFGAAVLVRQISSQLPALRCVLPSAAVALENALKGAPAAATV